MLILNDLNYLVIKLELLGMSLEQEAGEDVLVSSGAGEVWHDFVLYTLDNGWYGLENLSLIPGSVGASPIQNIGAYGVELKDHLEYLEALNKETLQLETFTKEDCHFGYRESIFKGALKGKYIITRVIYRLSKNGKINSSYGAISQQLETMGITDPTPKDISNAVIAIRRSKLPDPKEIGNSGSFFKNPIVPNDLFEILQKDYDDIPSYPVDETQVKIPAGWLIEKAGWKGKRFGSHGVHPHQALVLVNYGGATGEEIYALSSDIISSIEKKFGITLEREVNIIK